MRTLLLLTLVLIPVSLFAQNTLYVAPTGSDTAPGTRAAPLASLAGARDAVRKLKAAGPLTGPVTVLFAPGTYYLTEPVLFTPEDSGTATAPIIYKAQGPVIFSGGAPLKDLKETKQGNLRVWQTTLPEVKTGDWYFRQLFARKSGERFYTRRFRPTRGMLLVAGTTWSPARKAQAHRAAQPDFVFFKGDLQNFENLDQVELVAIHSWSASRLKIKELDLNKDIVTLTSVPTFRIGHWYKDEHNPYYLENLKEELKQPGQWYLDRPTGLFTYLPLPDETLTNTTLIAPRLEKLVNIQGTLDPPQLVSNLRFEGLTFAHTEWPVPEQGYDVSQGQPALPAAIELTAAQSCGFERCVMAHTGAYAVTLGLGSNGCYVRGCYLYDLGGGGVKVGASNMKQDAVYPTLPTDNAVENNLITDLGLTHYSANGIWCGIVKGTKIRHNLVRRGPYTGIACGWNWTPAPTSAGDNIIENNHVHNVMQFVQDGGGIYTLGRQPGNIIRGNLIHDNHKSPFACDSGQCGLYFDEGSTGFTVDDNIVYDVDWNNSQIAQNRNTAADHKIGTNYLGVRPDDPNFPKAIAARAGLEPAYRDIEYPIRLTPNPAYAMNMPVLPPTPFGLALDFEQIPLGEAPKKLSLAGAAGEAKFGATDETAFTGKQSLKIQDMPDLGRVFYPYAYYKGTVEKGEVDLSFALKQAADRPGEFSVEFRDYANKAPGVFSSGPTLVLTNQGKLMAGAHQVATLPLGQWSQLRLIFKLGEPEDQSYQLTITLPDKTATTLTLPFAKPEFTTVTDLYLVANDTKNAVTYLDDLNLTVK
ncbi:MAG: right-handed parallel beta-helix repeat-containing protein [Armatimonadia bacterium]